MATATFYQLQTSKITQIKRNLSLLMTIIILCSCSNDEWGNGNLVPPSGTAPEVISIVVKNQQGQNLLEPASEGSLANAKVVVSFCDKDFQVAETRFLIKLSHLDATIRNILIFTVLSILMTPVTARQFASEW